MLSGSADTTIRIWKNPLDNLVNNFNSDVDKEFISKAVYAHTSYVTCLKTHKIGSENYVISGSADRTIKIWYATTDDLLILQVLEGHQGWVNSLITMKLGLGADFVIISGSNDKSIRLWSSLNFRKISNNSTYKKDAHKSGITCLTTACYKDNFVIISGSDDMTIKVWNPLDIDTPILQITTSNAVKSLTSYFSNDVLLVAGLVNGTIQFFKF